jgi:regulator of replication initiation timing
VLIEELQDTVRAMAKENASVRKEADSLKAQVDMLLRDNRQLRFQQQLSNSRMSMPGMSEAQSPHQLGGGSLWSMHQQQQHQQRHHQQGMNANTGGMAGFSAIDQYLNAEANRNIGPMLGIQSGIEASNPIQAPPTNDLLTEQAREYLRGLSDRKNPML